MFFVLLGLIYTLPIIIFNFIINRYDTELAKMPFTGEEFGDKILADNDLKTVPIEASKTPDHYDPDAKAIRIKQQRLNRKSITALSIICHEIGHAIQDKEEYEPLKRRQRIIKYTHWISRLTIGISAIGIGPIIATGMIPLIKVIIFLVILGILINVVLHLITLDVEFDASFNRALPILRENIPEEYHNQCRYILSAAAFTYVVGSLSSLFSLRYWLILLRSIRR